MEPFVILAAILIQKPPAEYIRPYKGKVTWVRVPRNEVPHRCGDARDRDILGCAEETRRGRCTIILPRIGGDYTPEVDRKLREHELAHCNGWPEDHPGAVWQ